MNGALELAGLLQFLSFAHIYEDHVGVTHELHGLLPRQCFDLPARLGYKVLCTLLGHDVLLHWFLAPVPDVEMAGQVGTLAKMRAGGSLEPV
jgi:hypothetical protein